MANESVKVSVIRREVPRVGRHLVGLKQKRNSKPFFRVLSGYTTTLCLNFIIVNKMHGLEA